MVAPVFDDAAGYNDLFYSVARGRKYRSEIDILFNILEVLARRESGLKKTRLLQLANLNTSSFNKYIGLLERAGIVRVDGGLYRISRQGRLVHRLLRALIYLLDMNKPVSVGEETLRGICERLRERGAEGCAVDQGPFDVAFTYGGRAFGVIVSACPDEACPCLYACLTAAGNGYAETPIHTVILVNGQATAAEPVRCGANGLWRLKAPLNSPEAVADGLLKLASGGGGQGN